MVTLDKIVKKTNKFNGDIVQGAKDYERAKQGKTMIEEVQEEFKDMLKTYSGYNRFNIPSGTEKQEIQKGNVVLKITSTETTKKPAYKSAIVGMQNYVNTVNYMASRGFTISGVAKENGMWVMSVDKLLEEFQIRKTEILSPSVKQTITYSAPKKISAAQEVDLNGIDPYLSEESFEKYVQMDKIKKSLDAYVKDYESALKSSGQSVVKVNKNKAYELTENTKELTDWKGIMTTLFDDGEEDGELEILADEGVSFAEKKRELPFYNLVMREVRGEKKLYVGLESVYDRIEDLKGQHAKTSSTSAYVKKEVV